MPQHANTPLRTLGLAVFFVERNLPPPKRPAADDDDAKPPPERPSAGDLITPGGEPQIRR
jgi:hypothetical protein